ncbi:MAG: hypothetical protein ACLUEQ_10435 [Cloacibacillus evryensis]
MITNARLDDTPRGGEALVTRRPETASRRLRPFAQMTVLTLLGLISRSPGDLKPERRNASPRR